MMRIMHIALAGCLSAEPVKYGRTEDTGGHIAYVLGASAAQAAREDVSHVDIVTRAFRGPERRGEFWQRSETLGAKRTILRLRTENRRYLEKDDLAAVIPALTATFLDLLATETRPDVIHAHFSDAARLAEAACDRYGIPWVFSSHSLGLQKLERTPSDAHRARLERERMAIGEAGAIVASSRDEAERQIAAYDPGAAGRTFCVRPGVAVRAAEPADHARRLIEPFLRDAAKPVILLIARPVAKKNIHALVDAYAQSPILQRRANLVIVAGQREEIGDRDTETGRVVTELFDRIDRHDLWGRVALPRQHSQRDVASLYALAAEGGVFVNPAFHEPFGLTIVEAAQAGVPVVATCEGGPPEILRKIGYGRLIDPTDPIEIAEACLALLTDPVRATRVAHAKRNARKAFSWPRWAEDVQAVYRAIQTPDVRSVDRPSRILFTDIDNTLTGEKLSAASLRRHIEADAAIEMIPATGRAINEARRILAKWGYGDPSYLIASVGTEVWRRHGHGAYVLDHDYARRIDATWDREAVLQAVRRARCMLQPGYEQRRWKISCYGGAVDVGLIRAELRKAELGTRVVFSHGNLIDIIPVNAGKAAAAAHVAELLGVDRADCLAAGDSGNDADLLAWAARAVLPSNASAELEEVDGPSVYRSRFPYAAGVLDGLRRAGGRNVPVSRIAAE